jgi:carboxylesterase type B
VGIKTFGNFDFTPVQMLPFTGLFQRSISQSGTATCPWAVKHKGIPKAIAEQVAGLFDCPAHPSKDHISCLRKQDAYKLYNAERAIIVSCHIHAKYIMKLNSNKTNNHPVEHSRPASTN